MGIFGGLVVWAIIIGIIVYFVNKKKQEKSLAEDTEKQEKMLAEERRKKEIKELKIKWEEKKNEILTTGLPILDLETLKLTKNEVCHFEGVAYFCKVKQQTIGYEGGSRGVSFRVMKGINFRVGNFQGNNIKAKVTEKTNGSIYLTSKKIIFSAITNSRVIKYKDIINLSAIDNMLQIQTEKGTYLYEVDDFFNFMIILECIINRNKEDDLK